MYEEARQCVIEGAKRPLRTCKENSNCYARAARFMDRLEERGESARDGSKPREVLEKLFTPKTEEI